MIAKPTKLDLPKGFEREMRMQFAALCWCISADGKTRILLITSRASGRWIVPKGWPMDKTSPPDSAAIEAWEEAGVQGTVNPYCLGLFPYTKSEDDQRFMVAVYPLNVSSLAEVYPEAGQRKRSWFSCKRAASLVSEPDLAEIIRTFDPSALPDVP